MKQNVGFIQTPLKKILSASWESILDKASTILSELIRIKAIAGERRESIAANYLLKIAREMGLSCRIEEPRPGLGSFIAEVHRQRENSLLLLSHLDVAPVTSLSEWRFHPFSGEITEGAIWGRGAIDCQGLAVVWLMVLHLIERLAIPLRRSVVMVAAADEESGGRWGMEWLMDNVRELQKCRWALNEGGGIPLYLNHRNFITCQTGEKGYAQIRWKTPLRQIGAGDFTLNAPITPSVQRMLKELKPTWIPDSTVGVLQRLPLSMKPLGYIWLRYFQRHAPYRLDVRELFKHTVTIQSQRETLTLHIRSLPGIPIREIVSRAALRVGLSQDQAIISTSLDGTESPLDTNLYYCIEEVVEQFQPSVRLIPHITPGYSDSRYLRQKGIPTYGFFPLPIDTPITLQHAENEHLTRQGLSAAIAMLFEIVIRHCSQAFAECIPEKMMYFYTNLSH